MSRLALRVVLLVLVASLPAFASGVLFPEGEVALPAAPVAAAARPGSAEIWVSLADGSIAVLRGEPLQVAGRVKDVGNGCWGLAFRPDGKRLYGTDWMANYLVEVDADALMIRRRIEVGLKPAFPVLGPDGRMLYLTNYFSGELAVVDLEQGKTLDYVDVGRRPMGLALSADGRTAYVASGIAGKLTVVDLPSLKVVREMAGSFGTTTNLVLSGDGQRLIVPGAPNQLFCMDLSGQGKAIEVGTDPVGVALDPSGQHAFVTNFRDNTVSVVDLGEGRLVESVAAGDGPMFSAMSADGTRFYVCNSRSKSLSVFRLDAAPAAALSPAADPVVAAAPGPG